MIFLAKYWLHIIGAAILLAVLGFTYHLGGASARTELAEYKADVARDATRVAEMATKAEQAARTAEMAHAKRLAAVATQYEQDKINAQADADRVVSDLRAGNRRLQSLWQGSQATARLSGAVASAASADAEDRLREESAGRIIGAVAECQAQVKGLQAIVEADRQEDRK